jgi:hypothetical protein
MFQSASGLLITVGIVNGKRHEMPAHHKLEAFLDEYIRTAGIAGDERSPLFRSAIWRTGD